MEAVKGMMREVVPGASESTLMVRPAHATHVGLLHREPLRYLAKCELTDGGCSITGTVFIFFLCVGQVTEVACVGENCPPLSTAMVMMTPQGNFKRIIHCRLADVSLVAVRDVWSQPE